MNSEERTTNSGKPRNKGKFVSWARQVSVALDWVVWCDRVDRPGAHGVNSLSG